MADQFKMLILLWRKCNNFDQSARLLLPLFGLKKSKIKVFKFQKGGSSMAESLLIKDIAIVTENEVIKNGYVGISLP